MKKKRNNTKECVNNNYYIEYKYSLCISIHVKPERAMYAMYEAVVEVCVFVCNCTDCHHSCICVQVSYTWLVLSFSFRC